MKKGIIFDMDGTLWDSAPQVADSWNLVLQKNGVTREPLTKEDMYRVMGKTMDVLATMLLPDLEETKRNELLNLCVEEENDYLRKHGGTLYPNLRQTMEALKEEYDLYIVSNCQSGYIESFLDYYQFHDLFEDIECYGNNGKPKDENIALVVERNKLDKAVYVGDIEGDYEASQKAGIPFIHAAYGFGTISQKVPKIESLSEIVNVVGNVL
ncbi:MAG: HAD family hydrolase [Agathobacter sp.]|nr:HAD family hydrolase [Agathobacter sp.]